MLVSKQLLDFVNILKNDTTRDDNDDCSEYLLPSLQSIWILEDWDPLPSNRNFDTRGIMLTLITTFLANDDLCSVLLGLLKNVCKTIECYEFTPNDIEWIRIKKEMTSSLRLDFMIRS